MCSADPRECIVNHDVTATVDVRNASRATGVTTDDVAAPDAIVQLGTALDDVSTRVARRSLLDTVLTAAWERHTGDRALYTAKAHWARRSRSDPFAARKVIHLRA